MEMPKPSKFLSATQRDGKPIAAEEVYISTWKWIAERKCAMLVSPQLLERYAMMSARWIQCEEAISEFGFLAKHPTGEGAPHTNGSMNLVFLDGRNRVSISGTPAGKKQLSGSLKNPKRARTIRQ